MTVFFFNDPRLQSLRKENDLQCLFDGHILQHNSEVIAILDRVVEYEIEVYLFSKDI